MSKKGKKEPAMTGSTSKKLMKLIDKITFRLSFGRRVVNRRWIENEFYAGGKTDAIKR